MSCGAESRSASQRTPSFCSSSASLFSIAASLAWVRASSSAPCVCAISFAKPCDGATIARARIDTDNRRPPPTNWQSVIAEMAEAHARELEDRVQELRQLASNLAGSK